VKKMSIKPGQVWRCKQRNYYIVVSSQSRDGWWHVHPNGNKNKVHKMQFNSFHFYKLEEESNETLPIEKS
jgi:hypothetical protein